VRPYHVSSAADDVPNEAGESWPTTDETELVAAMRRGVGAAFTEVFRRFAPLLTGMARRKKVPIDAREGLVTEYLEDALIQVYRGGRAPTALGPYLAAGFRRRLVSAWRSRTTEEARQQQLDCADSRGNERIVAEGLSEYAVRTAQGPERSDQGEDRDDHDAPITEQRAPRAGLARALAAAMTQEELRLMGQVAERYPQREIAAAFGMTPIATRVRIHRLRERLAGVAAAYIATLPTGDGITLAQFLGTPRTSRSRHRTRCEAPRREQDERSREDTP
jgi:DNA-directed RNA polymerase specialized sigma24 family protein